jgi:hypothetical protein
MGIGLGQPVCVTERRLAMKARTALGTLLLLDLLLLGLIVAPTSGANAPAAAVEEDLVDQATDLPEGVSADWWTAAQEYIRRSEYDVTWSERTVLADVPAAYQAPNRAQGLRTYFTPDGIRVVPRTEESPSWQVGLGLAGCGSVDGGILPLPEASLQAKGNSIAYQRANISERYVNDEGGLEHQIVLSPTSSGVTLDLAVEGDLAPTLGGDGRAVEFTTAAGVVVLRYGDLQAIDASGTEVPLQLELLPQRGGLRLTLPAPSQGLTITARLTAPASATASTGGLTPSARWGAESDQGSARLGHAVGTAGDVNGDGYDDIIVGSYIYDAGKSSQGAAFVWHGSAEGLGATGRPGNADWKAYGDAANDWFGYAVATAGDVNGDGYGDVVVGARWYAHPEAGEGAAYVWYGSAYGLCNVPGPCQADAQDADWRVESNKVRTDLGNAVGTAGDVDGDGYDDLLVAAFRYDNPEENEGGVFLWYGSRTGLREPDPADTIDAVDWADWRAESDQAYAELGGSWEYDYRPMAGTAVATAGDVDGDGYGDIIVGAWLYDKDGWNDRGAVFVWEGSSIVVGDSVTPNDADWKAYGEHAGDWFGYGVGTAGDVNGDGASDIIVGARYYNNGTQYEGGAFVWYGSHTGLGVVNRTPDWKVESNKYGTDLGHTVGTAGDVNGDGYADILVAGAWYENDRTDEGGVWVWHGSADGLCDGPSPCQTDLNSADWKAEGDQDYAYFGYGAGTAGDVNGDGYDDLIVGAPYYNNPQADEGAAFVYLGSDEGLARSSGWLARGDQNGAYLGYSVGTAGDVNGDGYADVIAGAAGYDGGQENEGRVFVWYGTASGLGSPGHADWFAELDQAHAWFGWSVGTAGDVNGDGYADLIVGAHYYDSVWNDDRGGAFVWDGSAQGLASPGTLSNAVFQVISDQPGSHLGSAVGTAGDVNGDGFDDIIVGAPHYDSGQTDEGRVFVWHGSSGGLVSYGTPSNADWTAESNQAYSWFGNGGHDPGEVTTNVGGSVGTAGDVNGDGYDDVIVGAPYYDNGEENEGRAFVWYGSENGVNDDVDGDPDNAAWSVESNQQHSWFGWSLGTAGDVNGDGYSDVIIGARYYDLVWNDDRGGVFVYHGSGSGLSANADWMVVSDQPASWFGFAVGTAGDVNGDGFSDVIVSARIYDNGQENEGRVFVWYGSAYGLGPSNDAIGTADWTAESDQQHAHFGSAVGTAGDVNGDGYSDVIVGALYYDLIGNDDRGGVFVWYGSGQGLSGPASWAIDGEQSGAQLGYSVDSAGDINGDGYADVIIGAPYYDNGQSNEGRAYVFRGSASGLVTQTVWMAESDRSNVQFGSAVAGAGDVNGDGFSDVLIGAPSFSDGENEEGAVFVWLGSKTGLGSNGDPDNADWSAQGGQGGAYFGGAVAGAGDVNGDGYADVLIGAPGFSDGENETDEGAAFVWLGSATGLGSASDWSVEGDQVGAKFGHAAGTAGDVNGDGLSDVLVGAPSFDGAAVDGGRASLYLGSATGLGSTPDWSVEGEQQGVEFAYAVGTAGDVNGDGYSDVVIGAPFFEKGPTYHDWQEGGAFVWLGSGSATGLPCDDPPPDPCETDLKSAAWRAEGDRYNAQLGYAVGTAGDVNGDGYADVVVGAPYFNNGPSDEGQVLLYEGSVAGLSVTPRWSAEGDQGGALFGLAVAGAGDVDGNGFADVIVGAPLYDKGVPLTDAGRVSLYYGNGGDDQALTPRQMQIDGSTPIAPLGLSDSENTVGLRLTGRSPLGRGEVKLQWQVAPLGKPFTATGIISGSSSGWINTEENGADIAETVTGLSPGTLYHWRARLLYRPGNVLGIPASRWVHMPWNGWLETDFRTGGCAPPNSPAFEWTPSAPRVGQAVTFSGTCYGTPPLEYAWAFGDGISGDGATVMHSYVVSGTYNATMTVTGQCGGSATLAHTVPVSGEGTDSWVYLPLLVRKK